VPGPGAADPVGPGVVVVGAGGRLEHVTPAAESWLRTLSGPGERAAPGQPAPLPIAGLAVRARAGGTVPPLRIRTTGGEWLTVHAAPDLDPPAGGRTTLVLEASRPRELLPLLARAYRLTAREEQVVRLVLVGNSTREISHELRISAHTVQDHLKAVFDKTGVRSRRELAYRFALAYW
jgi:DNA-binding CsgD family transcriptional regulator